MDIAELINKASAEFDRLCQERHDTGAEKYGPFKFLGANTLEEAMAEVIDLSNYARYTFIRLYLLNLALDDSVPDKTVTVGPAFFSSKPDMETATRPQEEGK